VDTRKGGFAEKPNAMAGLWARYRGGAYADVPEGETRVPRERLVELLRGLTRIPDRFTPHPKIQRLFLESRRAMIPTGDPAQKLAPLDWGTAEALAFATLLTDG